jgi:hypothetical protein
MYVEDDKPKSSYCPTKGSYSKAKITPVYSNEPAPVVTELKAVGMFLQR